MQSSLKDEISLYLQISEMIETDILRGILLEDERVPSTNELSKLYTINPATAAQKQDTSQWHICVPLCESSVLSDSL